MLLAVEKMQLLVVDRWVFIEKMSSIFIPVIASFQAC